LKQSICFYGSLVERCKNSLYRFVSANRLVKDDILKPKNKPIIAIGMQIAGIISCQKFWIG